jgi:hypothetical protein
MCVSYLILGTVSFFIEIEKNSYISKDRSLKGRFAILTILYTMHAPLPNFRNRVSNILWIAIYKLGGQSARLCRKMCTTI